MYSEAISGAQQLFTLGPMIGFLVMLPIALISGMLPGGGLPVAIILLGFVGVFDPWVGVTLLVFYMSAQDITQPIPSILMGIPGSRSAQATILDGYPMAQQGLAGVALGASYMTTLIGGVLGAVVLLAALPFARQLLSLFGSAEFFMLSLMGVIAVAVVSTGALTKGLVTAAFGMAIAMIGFSGIGGVLRLDFGTFYLGDGISIVPIVVGLFAIPEVIDLVTSNTSIARERTETLLRESKRDVAKGMKIAFKHKWLMVRSSLIGAFVGAMPGVGGSAGHWIAYAQARQTEKGGVETFGTGDVRGVIASDSANNSSDGGQLIPTLVFGIPGSGTMAILLAMLMLYGIPPGPRMMTEHMDLTMALVMTVAFANILVVPVVLFFAPQIVRISAIPPNVLAPVVIGIVTLAAFMENQTMVDLVAVGVFTVIGVFMKKYGWPRPPILIAVVLIEIVERFFWLSLQNYGWGMFARPQLLVLMGIIVAVMAYSVKVQAGAKKAMQNVQATADEPVAEPTLRDQRD